MVGPVQISVNKEKKKQIRASKHEYSSCLRCHRLTIAALPLLLWRFLVAVVAASTMPFPRCCHQCSHCFPSMLSLLFSSSPFFFLIPSSFLCSSITPSTSPSFSSSLNHQYALAYRVSVHQYKPVWQIAETGPIPKKAIPAYDCHILETTDETNLHCALPSVSNLIPFKSY